MPIVCLHVKSRERKTTGRFYRIAIKIKTVEAFLCSCLRSVRFSCHRKLMCSTLNWTMKNVLLVVQNYGIKTRAKVF